MAVTSTNVSVNFQCTTCYRGGSGLDQLSQLIRWCRASHRSVVVALDDLELCDAYLSMGLMRIVEAWEDHCLINGRGRLIFVVAGTAARRELTRVLGAFYVAASVEAAHSRMGDPAPQAA